MTQQEMVPISVIKCDNAECGAEFMPMTGPLSQYERRCVVCERAGRAGFMRVETQYWTKEQHREWIDSL
jgi:hypothetical protein